MIDDRTVSRLADAIATVPGDRRVVAAQQASIVAPLLSEKEREALVRTAVNHVAGMGPLQRHLDDPDVSEVMVVGGESVWVERAGILERVGSIGTSELSLCLERITRVAGRRLDLLSPILDCMLPDGSRVCVVIPPVAVTGPSISIRKFTRRILPLTAFADAGALAVLEQLVTARCNVLVSGATSAGKSSLISAISHRFGVSERVVCIEDTAELRFAHGHLVRLQSRPATPEGAGEVTMQHLVRASLRMRPDRLVVGEVRGAEVVDMLLALSSGHTGCWSTVHSTGARDTLDRIRALVVRDAPQWPANVIDQTIASAIDAIVHMEKNRLNQRRVSTILEVVTDHGCLDTRVLYEAGTTQ